MITFAAVGSTLVGVVSVVVVVLVVVPPPPPVAPSNRKPSAVAVAVSVTPDGPRPWARCHVRNVASVRAVERSGWRHPECLLQSVHSRPAGVHVQHGEHLAVRDADAERARCRRVERASLGQAEAGLHRSPAPRRALA